MARHGGRAQKPRHLAGPTSASDRGHGGPELRKVQRARGVDATAGLDDFKKASSPLNIKDGSSL